MPKPLSDRQQSILGFLQDYIQENQYSPTMREIALEVDISSTSVVKYNLDILERTGHIERDPEVSRGIRLIESPAACGTELFRAPLLGRIAANMPIPIPDGTPSSSTSAATIELPRELVGDSRDVYALQVRGDSLADALVGDGDIVLIQHLARVRNGDLAAVWLRDREQTTLRHFYLDDAQVHLHPANPTLSPVSYPADSVVVMGKVVCVLRHLT
jgi:repressor LexA